MIYEARPNVTADAAGLCLKSGNAVLLRGSSSAARSNAAIVAVLREAVVAAGLPADAISLVDSSSRATVKELMTARGLVDVLIPRGGADLIRSVVEGSTVPVIETGVGNCHVYVDADADLRMALDILLNAKTSRPSVCNAAESLLVHAAVADEFLALALPALQAAGVTVHGSPDGRRRRRGRRRARRPATDDDFAREYLSLDLSAAVVPRWTRRSRTSAGTAPGTPRRSSPARRRRPGGSWPRSTRPRCWSTRRAGSSTAASSDSAPRSASRRRSCTPAARWACPS